jgi:beta-lactamase class A
VRRGSYTTLRWLAISLLFAAILVLVFQLVEYSRLRSNFAPGTVIAGVSVGGLDQQEAANRLTQAYSVPIELHYNNDIIQVKPAAVGFALDTESMVAAADVQRTNTSFWGSFWNYLWNKMPAPSEIPLSATIAEEQLRSYLQNEISPRYDQPPTPSMPIPGDVRFDSGKPGTILDVDRSVTLIEDALRSPTGRVVTLPYSTDTATKPGFNNLQVMLQQIIDASKFDGIVEIYIQDLQTGQELNFATQNGQSIPSDITFSAASTIKIPIMISIFRHESEPLPADINTLLTQMIALSNNDATDSVMKTVLDVNLGPLTVTSDMKALGLQNTFLAGYFYNGAPLLQRFTTPSNSRTDVDTSPDPYNQTTPADLGMLLEDIYQCSRDGGGTFAVAFPGQISQTECQMMINYLEQDRNGVLLQAGLPDGTKFAHKHGWITDTAGVIHTFSDAGIVFSPGGNYSISVSLYDSVQAVFDTSNLLLSNLSAATYNYFNLGQ